GNAERPADLHQLAARHDRLAVAGECREREQQRPCGVVHHERVGGPGELGEEAPAEPVARATGSPGEIVFQVRVLTRDAPQRREQRGDVALGKQGLDGRQPAARVAHGGLMESRGARVVSRGAGAGFGTGTVSTPWASAATAPLRLVASRTRIRYFLPGSSGCAAWTTSRSDGTRRCFKSWRIFVVSTR